MIDHYKTKNSRCLTPRQIQQIIQSTKINLVIPAKVLKIQFKKLEDHGFFETNSIELDPDMIKLIDKHQYYSTFRVNKSDISNKDDYACHFLSSVIKDIQADPHKFSYKDFDCINKMVNSVINDREVTINYIDGTHSNFKNSNM